MLRVQVMLGAFTNKVTFINVVKQNLFRKKVLFIIKIRKHEAKYLRDNNYGWVVISGHGTYRNLLMVEDTKALLLLEKYRKSIIVK